MVVQPFFPAIRYFDYASALDDTRGRCERPKSFVRVVAHVAVGVGPNATRTWTSGAIGVWLEEPDELALGSVKRMLGDRGGQFGHVDLGGCPLRSVIGLDADERQTVQYFEEFASRAMCKDGWWAASRSDRLPWDFRPRRSSASARNSWL
jgi:hypothetical protein